MTPAVHHPAVLAALRHFRYDHLPSHLQRVSEPCAHLANLMVQTIPSDPELTLGLHKLKEAKDCFVRAAVVAEEERLAATVVPTGNEVGYPETRWRPIDPQGNVATNPAPDHPEEHYEGETGPPQTEG